MLPHVRHWIESAYLKGNGDSTAEDTIERIRSGRALLWVSHKNHRLLGAVVTEVWQEPKKRLCVILCAGGISFASWKSKISVIEEYARSEKCDAVRIYGRKGWARMYPHYKQPWIALERAL